ncbi:MAG TPA: amine oxidase [Clostridiaceae bacterium]|nr:amine oxidase [Clostridiaceae bacterium]
MMAYNFSVPYQFDNPTDEQRHAMLKYYLSANKRLEDYDNIIGLMSPPKDILTICPKNCGKNVKVGIIGCGEAGLSAAFELKKIGCDITLFEATDSIGGRAKTHYFDPGKKYFGDLGPMRVPVSHETTWHYINLFRLRTMPFATNNINGLFYVRKGRAVNDPAGYSVMRNIYPRFNMPQSEKNIQWQKLADSITEKYFSPLSPEIRKELVGIYREYSDQIIDIDKYNYRRAYENAGLSQNAISMLGYVSTFDKTFFRLSLTEILQEIYTSDFIFTYYIDGGMANLPLALFHAIKYDDAYNISKEDLGNVSIRMNCAIDGIYQHFSGKEIILEYRDENTYNYNFERFDYVICAIPFSSLRRNIVDPPFSIIKSQAVNELNYESAHKILLLLKDRFWEKGNPNRRIVGGSSSTDLPLISIYYPSDHAMPIPGVLNGWTLRPNASPDEPGVILASYSWPMESERLGNEYECLKLYDVFKYLEKVHRLPWGSIDKKVLSYKTITWSHVQYEWGAACLTKPQDKTLFSYNVTLPEMNGRIFFAGEHISQKHAWQQGALQTGMLCANHIAERIKESRS